MSAVAQRYNVGGVYLPRPFKIRRLGHFGFNVDKLPEEAASSTATCSASRSSDTLDFSRAPWFPKDTDVGDPHGYFMRYGTDHHAFVLFPKRVMDHRADRKFAPEVTINQITWQCGSLREIGDAHRLLRRPSGPHPARRPRHAGQQLAHLSSTTPTATPTNSITASSRSAGTSCRSRASMYYRGFHEKPRAAADVRSRRDVRGARTRASTCCRAIARSGPPEDLRCRRRAAAAAVQDHQDRPGEPLRRRCRARRGLLHRAARLCAQRGGAAIAALAASSCAAAPSITALALFPKELRGNARALSPHTTCMSFGIEVGSYAQLREAVDFLKAHGVDLIDAIPPELYPGIDYSAFAARSRRPLHPALLLHGAGRLGRPRAPGLRAPPCQRQLARSPGAALRHLCRPGLPGPARLKERENKCDALAPIIVMPAIAGAPGMADDLAAALGARFRGHDRRGCGEGSS